MLSKEQRMSKALAREVFMHGASTSTPNFLLKTSKSPTSLNSQTLFAVSVSKKIAPTAVLRNRTRRRVYSVIRNFLPKIRPGFCAAITVKKGGEKLVYDGVVKEVELLLGKAGLVF